LALKYFGDKVAELTGGRVKFQYYWGGTLAKAGEEYQAIQKGVADIGVVGYGFHPSEFRAATFFYVVPFSPSDPITYHKVVESFFHEVPTFREEVGRYNMRFLYPNYTDSYELNTLKPVRTLEDMKGLKISAFGAYLPRIVNASGATATTTPMVDRAMNLQTRVIDGQVLPLSGIYKFKFHQIAPNVTVIGMGCAVFGATCINMNTWNRLPQDIQEVFEKVAAEAGLWQANYHSSVDAEAIDKMKAGGAGIFYLSEQDKKKWAEAMDDYPAEWANKMKAQGLPGWEIWEKYVSSAKKAGYQFVKQFGVR
jgi:TRAP-type C4-dicarboxylate transport system substrate-binding protein